MFIEFSNSMKQILIKGAAHSNDIHGMGYGVGCKHKRCNHNYHTAITSKLKILRIKKWDGNKSLETRSNKV